MHAVCDALLEYRVTAITPQPVVLGQMKRATQAIWQFMQKKEG